MEKAKIEAEKKFEATNVHEIEYQIQDKMKNEFEKKMQKEAQDRRASNRFHSKDAD